VRAVDAFSSPWQQYLYFLPLLHGHGSLREIFFMRRLAIDIHNAEHSA
jgi:hypothetical protein